MSTLADSPGIKVYVALVVAFLGFLTVGALVVARPPSGLSVLAALAAMGLCAAGLPFLRHSSLEVWHVLALAAISGYLVLSYGFANLAFHLGGVPFAFGHVLVFGALGLAVLSNSRTAIREIKEPAMLCLLGLILLALPHLVLDIPRYGLYAVRDASIFFEGIFLLLGLLWATNRRNTVPLVKWLLFVFVVNLVYSYSLPWAERLVAWSPRSGVFLSVPVIGFYTATYLYLLLGALFCLWLGCYVKRWPRWVWLVLAVAQLAGLAIHQARSTYLGIVVVLVLLLLLGEVGKVVSLSGVVSLCLMAVLFLSSFLGIQIPGRIGPVNLTFLEAHARSLLFEAGTPEEESIEGRQGWYRDAWSRVQSGGGSLLVGEGFGKPLTDLVIGGGLNGGVEVRQPHNSSLTVLARLGLVGMAVWLVFHFFVLRRFLAVFRRRSRLEKGSYALVLWLFFCYVMAMIVTSVQPYLDFSYGAIPFYFLMGFSLGFLRRQVGRIRSRSLSRTSAAKWAA